MEFKTSLAEERAASDDGRLGVPLGGWVFFGVNDDGTAKGVHVGKNTLENLAAAITDHPYPSVPAGLKSIALRLARTYKREVPADVPPSRPISLRRRGDPSAFTCRGGQLELTLPSCCGRKSERRPDASASGQCRRPETSHPRFWIRKHHPFWSSILLVFRVDGGVSVRIQSLMKLLFAWTRPRGCRAATGAELSHHGSKWRNPIVAWRNLGCSFTDNALSLPVRSK